MALRALAQGRLVSRKEAVVAPVQCVGVDVKRDHVPPCGHIQAGKAVLDQKRGSVQQRPQNASGKEEMHGAKSSAAVHHGVWWREAPTLRRASPCSPSLLHAGKWQCESKVATEHVNEQEWGGGGPGGGRRCFLLTLIRSRLTCVVARALAQKQMKRRHEPLQAPETEDYAAKRLALHGACGAVVEGPQAEALATTCQESGAVGACLGLAQALRLSTDDAGDAFLSLFGSDTVYDSGAVPSAAPAAACPSDGSAPSASGDATDEEAEAPCSSSAVEEVVFQPRARKRAPRRCACLGAPGHRPLASQHALR